MSLSWRDRVCIHLVPGRVWLTRSPRGWRRGVSERKTVDCAGAGWQPALEALREALTHPNLQPAEATVVLSNHFVRYLLILWNPALAGEREELAFARARFVQVYGEAAQGWVLRLSGGGAFDLDGAGAPQIAAAIERPLLDGLGALLGSSPLRLRSIQPQFMAVVNGARARLPGNAWLAVAEPGRVLLGLLRGGHWQSLRGRPLNGEPAALAPMLEQERLLLGLEPAGERIFVHAQSQSQAANMLGTENMPGTDNMLDIAGLQVERLPEFGLGAGVPA